MVKLNSLKDTFCNNGCTAVVDTSTNTIKVPKTEVDALNDAIGAKKMQLSNRYWVCMTKTRQGHNILQYDVNRKKI